MKVQPGLEVLVEQGQTLIADRRLGLLAHPASVSRSLAPAARVLEAAGGRIERLFAPEHGIGGGYQDMEAVDELRDPVTGLPIVSLYGETEDQLTPSPSQLEGLDLLVVDLMDVGARYYTFAATAIRLLPVAAEAGVQVVVADRPNPLGGLVMEGNLILPGQESFVGEISVPSRHGMSLGELCRLARAERSIDVDLRVIPARGWRREQYWDETGLPWVLPSPNMPTLETALVYPGACLVEGTNFSEGRGTTRPFELIGAPFLEPEPFAARLNRRNLPGVAFRPVSFVPAFQKHAGRLCGGVQLHVTDRHSFPPVRTGLELLAAARESAPEAFAWRREPYEFVADRPAIDLLAGGPGWRQALEEGADPAEIAADWPADLAEFAPRREPHLLY